MQFCGRCPILLECSAVIVFLLSCFGGSAWTSLNSGTFQRDGKLNDLLPTDVTQWSPLADTVVECGKRCQTEKWCNSFFYNPDKKTCVLQRMVYASLASNQTIAAPGWKYYRLTSVQCQIHRGYANDRLTATCYRLVTSPVLNWTNARDACFNNNETLVVLEPVEKGSFIHDFVIINYAPHGYTKNIAIGASRPEADWGTNSTSFQWVNGQPLDRNATEAFMTMSRNWEGLNSDVLTIRINKDFLWGSVPGWKKRPYICERTFT